MLAKREKRTGKRFSGFADQRFLPHYLSGISPFYSTLKYMLLLLAFTFMVLALARPQWDFREQDLESQGADLMVCLDISRSMDANDSEPSRLLRAKMEIMSLLDHMDNDRVGIIAFAGIATLECPLTDDLESARIVLTSLDTSTAVSSGTDVGAALKLADRSLQSSGGNNIILLVSDGEDLEGGALGTSSRLASAGTTIFTLGVGTEEGATIRHPVSGEEAFTKADFNILEKIAAAGGGSFHRVSPNQSELEMILGGLHSEVASLRRGSRINVMAEQFHFFVGFALLFLMVESLVLPIRRKRTRS
jgi:Ca-activated chloride channel family protein